MADIREPAAWVNSARMSGAFYMYVEGESDERFWNKFIDSSQVQLQVCHSCKILLEVVKEHIKQNVLDYVAVTDRDFHAILGTTPTLTNLFITDDHDLELMMYHKGNAFSELTNAIDRGGRIKAYLKSGHDLLNETMVITDDIGYCKLVSHRNGYTFKFDYQDKKTHEIIRPKYEDALDGKTGAYLGLDRIIKKVHGFTSSCKCTPSSEKLLIEETVKEKDNNSYDSWQLSNGHDVSYLLPFLIRRCCNFSRIKLDKELIDTVLYAAYKAEDLFLTDIYSAIKQWSKTNKKALLRV